MPPLLTILAIFFFLALASPSIIWDAATLAIAIWVALGIHRTVMFDPKRIEQECKELIDHVKGVKDDAPQARS